MLINTLSLGIHTSNETTPVTAMGCRQCLPLSVVQLKGKHCPNGVVDTFRLLRIVLVFLKQTLHVEILSVQEISVSCSVD